jgi:hypothetical protein
VVVVVARVTQTESLEVLAVVQVVKVVFLNMAAVELLAKVSKVVIPQLMLVMDRTALVEVELV